MARFSLWCRGVRTAEVQSGHHHHHHHHIMYRRVMDDDDGGVVCLRSTVRLPLTADHSRHSSGCGWMDVGAVAFASACLSFALALLRGSFSSPYRVQNGCALLLEGGGRWFMHGRLSVCFMYRWCLERDENGMYCLVYWF